MPKPSSCRCAILLLALVACTWRSAPAAAQPGEPPPLRIAAAISLREALVRIAELAQREAGLRIEPVFGSSGQLLEQIRNGAPLDVFISAANEQMDVLERSGLIIAATRRVIARNELVLIAPAGAGLDAAVQSLPASPGHSAPGPAALDRSAPERAAPAEDAALAFARRLQDAPGRIAIGAPASVPAGAYARQVLERLALYETLQPRLVFGTNVRQVLDYVERGEAALGLVYRTDARAAGPRVRVLAVARPEWHAALEYPAAVIAHSRNPDAAAQLVRLLATPAAQAALAAHGFIPAGPDAAAALEAGPSSPATAAAASAPATAAVASAPATAAVASAPGAAARPVERAAGSSTYLLSLFVASAATLCVCLAAIPLAYRMARARFTGRSALETLLTLPLVLPPTVVGYLIIVALGARGFLGQWLEAWLGYSLLFRVEGAVLAAAIVAFPLVYLPARAAFRAVDAELHEMATILGASRRQVFWHVALPIARSGIISGVILCFARALGEFGATVMVFGWQPGRATMPIAIYAAYEQGQLARAAPLVLAMIGICFALLVLYNRAERK